MLSDVSLCLLGLGAASRSGRADASPAWRGHVAPSGRFPPHPTGPARLAKRYMESPVPVDSSHDFFSEAPRTRRRARCGLPSRTVPVSRPRRAGRRRGAVTPTACAHRARRNKHRWSTQRSHGSTQRTAARNRTRQRERVMTRASWFERRTRAARVCPCTTNWRSSAVRCVAMDHGPCSMEHGAWCR